MDAVCSGIVVYGGGDIVFDQTSKSNSGIWWLGQCKKSLSLMQKGQTSGCSHTVDTVHSGHSGCSGCSMQWTQ